MQWISSVIGESGAEIKVLENRPRGVNSSMQIAPPSITKPFSILGSTTRMKGGAKGKLSGKMRWSRMLGTSSSIMSWASGDSGSRWYNRTCHSNKLSLINSACEWRRTNRVIVVVKMRENLIFMQIFVSKFTEKIFSLRSFCDFCSSLNSFISRLARIVVSIFGAMGSFVLLLLLGAMVLLIIKPRMKRILTKAWTRWPHGD